MKRACQELILFGFSFLPFMVQAEIELNFKVNMQQMIELEKFDPNVEFVDIAGTFNNWGESLQKLIDPDKDGIYSTSISGFKTGQKIEFKFRINGHWDGREEFPGGGPNRTYTVQDPAELLFWYNDMLPPDAPLKARMSVDDNEVYSGSILSFIDRSDGTAENRLWYFEGGFPNMSESGRPLVKYDQPGSYDVTLIVNNTNTSDTLIKEDYITIKERADGTLGWWNERVFYEIFVRSFFDSDADGIGDFQGLIEKIDYLNDADPETNEDLGISGIWLMPIHPSPSYHGYDVTDYKAINPDYGSMDDFKEFLQVAHEHNIRVIIDFVMNHTSSQHQWFQESSSNVNSEKREFYRWEETRPDMEGPWGQQIWHQHQSGYYYGLFWNGMPDLNYNFQPVKDSMFAIASYWLNEIGVDGFRLDAVKYIKEDENALEDIPATFEFWKEFTAYYKMQKPDAFAVGEAWTSTNTVKEYVHNMGLDFCFEFDLATQIIEAVNSQNSLNLARQIQKAYNVYPNLQFGTFLSNHDQVRVINSLGDQIEKAKLAASIYLSLPGIPFIYYGEEIGMQGNKPDQFIRTPMQWSSESMAGFSEGHPWIGVNSDFSTINVATEMTDNNSLFRHYQQLIQIRQQQKAIAIGDYIPIYTSNPGVLGFMRSYQGENIMIALNLSPQIQNTDFDLTFSELVPAIYQFENLIDGDKQQYQISNDKILRNISFDPYKISMWKIDQSLPVRDLSKKIAVKVFPNPVNDEVQIFIEGLQSTKVKYIISDIRGHIVQKGEVGFQNSSGKIDLTWSPSGPLLLQLSDYNQRYYSRLLKFK